MHAGKIRSLRKLQKECAYHFLFTLRRKSALQHARVTHVLSALDGPISPELVQGYQHMQINIQDVEEENILEHFPKAVAFIHDGLKGSNGIENVESDASGNGVIVHCAMGKSRSATLVIAFLLHATRHLPLSTSSPSPTSSSSLSSAHPDYSSLSNHSSYPWRPRLNPSSALTLLRKCRPIAEPNEGFMDQLQRYHEMGCPATANELDNHPQYQRWLYQRHLDECLAADQAPSLGRVRFEDEHEPNVRDENDQNEGSGKSLRGDRLGPMEGTKRIRCRKCRTTLATGHFVLEHMPKAPNDKKKSRKESRKEKDVVSQQQQCAHFFVSPLSWMRPFLSTPSDPSTSLSSRVVFSNDSSFTEVSDEEAPGPLAGRLLCPSSRCRETNVGKFAWAARKSVDVIDAPISVDIADGQGNGVMSTGGSDSGDRGDNGSRREFAAGMGIRMPPGSGYEKGKM
ncbi:MAG: hypothetical protein Q9160_008561 [Pyrenula sp. 1 TL-2023]